MTCDAIPELARSGWFPMTLFFTGIAAWACAGVLLAVLASHATRYAIALCRRPGRHRAPSRPALPAEQALPVEDDPHVMHQPGLLDPPPRGSRLASLYRINQHTKGSQ